MSAGRGALKTEFPEVSEAQELQAALTSLERDLENANYALDQILNSHSWRITAPLRWGVTWARRIKRGLIQRLRGLRHALKNGDLSLLLPGPKKGSYFFYPADRAYAAWIRKYEPDDKKLEVLKTERFTYEPKISVLLPVYNPPEKFLREAIESVKRQVYSNWELCIADDASSEPYVRNLLDAYQQADSRIKVVLRPKNGHISAASNSALSLVTGDYVALLDHDDLLAPHALIELVRCMQGESPDILYSNEDKIDLADCRSEPTFKAAWSPDYFLSFMYIGHLSAYRTALVREVGGFREGFEGSQDYDLALRVSERTGKIKHVPHILYHWRKHEESVAANIHAKPYAFTAAEKALNDALARRGSTARAEKTKLAGVYRTRYAAPSSAEVSLFLFANRETAASDALHKLTKSTPFSFTDTEVGFVRAKSEERVGPNTTHLSSYAFSDRAAFWSSALKHSRGEYVLLLDHDLVPASEGWMEELLGQISRSEISAVGPKLLMPDRSVVSAGYTLQRSILRHRFYGVKGGAHGYALRLSTPNNVAALSSSALMIRRKDLEQNLQLGFSSQAASDLALALALREMGGYLLWTPYAEFQLTSRRPLAETDLSAFPADLQKLQERRETKLIDPFYPPGLDDEKGDFSLKI